nr:hypothetical protein [Parapedobacter sp. ISTM3]
MPEVLGLCPVKRGPAHAQELPLGRIGQPYRLASILRHVHAVAGIARVFAVQRNEQLQEIDFALLHHLHQLGKSGEAQLGFARFGYRKQQQLRLFKRSVFRLAQPRGKGVLRAGEVVHRLHELAQQGAAMAVSAVAGYEAGEHDAEERKALGLQLDDLLFGVPPYLRTVPDERSGVCS